MFGPNGYEDRNEEDGPFGTGFSEVPNPYGGYHRTLWYPGAGHISWDTDDDDYYYGYGHEVDDEGDVVDEWK